MCVYVKCSYSYFDSFSSTTTTSPVVRFSTGLAIILTIVSDKAFTPRALRGTERRGFNHNTGDRRMHEILNHMRATLNPKPACNPLELNRNFGRRHFERNRL